MKNLGHYVMLCNDVILNLEDDIPIFTVLDGNDEIMSYIYKWRNADEKQVISFLTHETLHWVLWKTCGKCTSNERIIALLERLSMDNMSHITT